LVLDALKTDEVAFGVEDDGDFPENGVDPGKGESKFVFPDPGAPVMSAPGGKLLMMGVCESQNTGWGRPFVVVPRKMLAPGRMSCLINVAPL